MKIPISSLSGARLCVMDGLVQKDGEESETEIGKGFNDTMFFSCGINSGHTQHTQPFTRHIFSLCPLSWCF